MKKLSKKILITTLLFALCLITISAVNAATYNIDNGTNLNNFITDTAQDDDIINLDEGTYNYTHINNTIGITINKNLTIIGKGVDKTIINAQKKGRMFYIQSNGTLTLINLTLINGESEFSGAILNEGKLTITNCTLNNNSAIDGGAIYNDLDANLTITNCTFDNNSAISGGGGIYNNCSANFTITNTTFNNNTANYGGAICIENGTNFTITNSTFINNTAEYSGGAIYNYGDNFIITGSTFNNNIANNLDGGAIYNYGDNLTITGSTFINNTAEYDGGGAIFNIGDNMCLSGSTFIGNSAKWGGAIELYGNYIRIIGCIFDNNTANDGGGGINNNRNNISISKCTFTNNKALMGGAIRNQGPENMTIIGCNFINNENTILINTSRNNTVINYNRFLNNTGYDVNNTGNNTNVDFNWWGNNTPTKIIGITPNNYFVMNVTNLTSLDSNGTVTFQYSFKLNNSDSFDAILLPYFVTDVYTNLTGGVITSFDARFDRTFDVAVNTSGDVLYTFATDNEVQTLEGNAIIPIPPEPPIPPIPPTPTPEPEDNNKTSNNPTVSAVMKETGIPINLILLAFCSVLAVLIGRRQN